MTRPTIHTGPGIKVTDVRKAIKQAAKAGGDYHVQVDMRPTSAHDARQLMILAGGSTPAMVEQHHQLIAEMEKPHHRYSRRRHYGDNEARLQRIREAGPQRRFKADPAYEARMASWAAGIIERENEQRAADAPRRVAVTA